jgi:hypothetical protein
MPQMTEAQVGVSVSLPLKYSNIRLIFELIETDNETFNKPENQTFKYNRSTTYTNKY